MNCLFSKIRTIRIVLVVVAVVMIAGPSVVATAAEPPVVMKVVMLEDEDENPTAAGRQVAEQLLAAMGSVEPRVVFVSECFEDRENKEALLAGITSVLPAGIVVGGSTYGSFTQRGCTDFDAVCLLGLGGDGLGVSMRRVGAIGASKLTFEEDQEKLVGCLRKAGHKLADGLARTERDRICLVIADAHSPKNGPLVEGMQEVLGKDFAITGGSCNKNAGQTFVYFDGKLHQDAAVAVMLSGDFGVALSGRQANTNESVIATAREGAVEALDRAEGQTVGVLAFNCAGRRGKLDRFEDELESMQVALGRKVSLFGCYCAGEIGPVDIEAPETRCGGSGWHVMYTVLFLP